MFSLPPVTQALIIINVLAFLLQSLLGDGLTAALALWPLGTYFMPWQIVTYAFLHGSTTHLLFNMFGVYMFGSDLERIWGSRRYLTFYMVSAIAAAIAQQIVSSLSGAVYPTVGASGAVFGLLLGFAMVFPRRMVVPLFPPIPMRAPIFVALYGGLELFLGVTGTQAGVAHFAHLGGMAGGYLLLRYWRGAR
ncbi:MAG: rhomboid family intramembrane serine protease [Betaproteobacteria bacterium]|nr:rhomboid family intramembrane serine protease [Betaproteobacteria bacterium]MBK9607015.1 rhomboid family intramembrane serine protease [Betaproteobacteria bacterium]